MRPGRRFQAAVWLCACTSAERAHAAMKEANREKAWMHLCPPARARSLPGNCGCSGTRSEPRPCGRPRLCAVRSHNQRLGRQEDDTQKHTHTHREGKKGSMASALDPEHNDEHSETPTHGWGAVRTRGHDVISHHVDEIRAHRYSFTIYVWRCFSKSDWTINFLIWKKI